MRDPARIDPFLSSLGELWKQHPDLRFGQLVMNLSRNEDGTFADPWGWEEDEWLRRINEAPLNWPNLDVAVTQLGDLDPDKLKDLIRRMMS